MSLRTVLVDDEKPARDRLRRLLEAEPDVLVVGEAGDVDSAVELIDRVDPDLLFLDVKIPGGDGFDVLRRVRRRPEVIFSTAYDAFAVRAFEVASIDYLLKPIAPRRLAEAVARARTVGAPARDAEVLRLLQEIRQELRPAPESPADRRIPARRRDRVVLLEPAEIAWFEAEDTLVFARTATERLLVERTLADLEAALAPGFFRVHRGYLVNLSRVTEVRSERAGQVVVVRDGSHPVPLSRRQARRLREVLGW